LRLGNPENPAANGGADARNTRPPITGDDKKADSARRADLREALDNMGHAWVRPGRDAEACCCEAACEAVATELAAELDRLAGEGPLPYRGSGAIGTVARGSGTEGNLFSRHVDACPSSSATDRRRIE